MGESRIKNKPSGGWTHILNSVAQDRRLNLDTRGLFLMMKSFPPDWEFNIPGLATMGSCGKDKVRRMLGELESAGYLLREQGHDETGKFSGNTYVLQDHPPSYGKTDDGKDEKEAVVGKTDDGKTRQRETPSSGNPTQTKEYRETKEESKLPPLPPEGVKRITKYDLQEDAKPILRQYCGTDQEMARALADLIEVRREKKAINSARAISALLTELNRLSEGDRTTKLLLVRQSIANSWKSVFPLRGASAPLPSNRYVEEERGTYML